MAELPLTPAEETLSPSLPETGALSSAELAPGVNQASYRVIHETEYHYGHPVALSQQLLHLAPRDLPWQHIASQSLRLSPEPALRLTRQDAFGNPVTLLAFETPHDCLVVRAETRVTVYAHQPDPGAGQGPDWETAVAQFRYSGASHPPAPQVLDASQFLFASPFVPLGAAFAAFAADCFPPGRSVLAGARALMGKIYREFQFDEEATSVATPVAEVLEKRRGVCQDFAHLMLACLRSLGLPARYVSGYILTLPPPGQPRLVGADASHAWVSLFCPEVGWVDLDPTNNLLPDLQHITLAWGRDFSDVSPMRGVILGGGAHDLEVRVTVQPEGETDGVSPGAEAAWGEGDLPRAGEAPGAA